MIKNEKQLATTRSQLHLLAEKHRQLKEFGTKNVLIDAQIQSLASDMSRLESEVAEYQAIRKGAYDVASIAAVFDLGKRLVQARIAANLTQHELAKLIGRKDQQVQRYERTQYGSASLSVIKKVAHILAGSVREQA
jgi:ribosome-binding protein aMBF1 (putative translation factor)